MVQNAPEKTVIIDPPSPNLNTSRIISNNRGELSSQVVANVEHNLPRRPLDPNRHLELSYVFEDEISKNSKEDVNMYIENDTSSNTSTQKSETIKSEQGASPVAKVDNNSIGGNSCDALELNIQEILALDIEFTKRNVKSSNGGGHSSKTVQQKMKPRHVFKSLPNLSASSENLLL